MSEWETAERWGEPIAPGQADDPVDSLLGEELVECFCGHTWNSDLGDSCPSCGRNESEQALSDQEMEAE